MLWHGRRGGDDSLKVLDGRARTKMVGFCQGDMKSNNTFAPQGSSITLGGGLLASLTCDPTKLPFLSMVETRGAWKKAVPHVAEMVKGNGGAVLVGVTAALS